MFFNGCRIRLLKGRHNNLFWLTTAILGGKSKVVENENNRDINSCGFACDFRTLKIFHSSQLYSSRSISPFHFKFLSKEYQSGKHLNWLVLFPIL